MRVSDYLINWVIGGECMSISCVVEVSFGIKSLNVESWNYDKEFESMKIEKDLDVMIWIMIMRNGMWGGKRWCVDRVIFFVVKGFFECEIFESFFWFFLMWGLVLKI